MKKLFLFVSLFAALSTGVYADDIWGNSQNDEETTDDAMGTRSWMRARPATGTSTWAGDDTTGETSPGKNEIPVGEGALVLLIGGGLYAVSKLRRK